MFALVLYCLTLHCQLTTIFEAKITCFSGPTSIWTVQHIEKTLTLDFTQYLPHPPLLGYRLLAEWRI